MHMTCDSCQLPALRSCAPRSSPSRIALYHTPASPELRTSPLSGGCAWLGQGRPFTTNCFLIYQPYLPA